MPDTNPNRYRAILLFGMPGSGKGTQGAILGQIPGMVHVSSGELFRKLPKWGELGREVLHYTTQGLLVPDELTIRIYLRHIRILELQELLLPKQHTLVLDGLPRNARQVGMLADVLDVVQIFHLCIRDTASAIERLQARALKENRLDDASEEIIRKRLRIYHQETFDVLSRYSPDLVTEVDGTQSPLGVLCDIATRLREIEGRRLQTTPPPLGPPVEV